MPMQESLKKEYPKKKLAYLVVRVMAVDIISLEPLVLQLQ